MKFQSSLLLLAAAIASCALVLSSCGSGNSESSNDIKVSEIASWDAGVKAYFKWLDGEGGIDGKLVTLISKDDGGDPAKNAGFSTFIVIAIWASHGAQLSVPCEDTMTNMLSYSPCPSHRRSGCPAARGVRRLLRRTPAWRRRPGRGRSAR